MYGEFASWHLIGNPGEYLTNPLGIDVPSPRFSWINNHTSRAQDQTAYRILVSLSPAVSSGDQWDSGLVNGTFSGGVAYAGAALKSDATYYWKVQWWDSEGVASPWSAVASFDTGLFSESDWQNATWITSYNMFRHGTQRSAAL